MTDAPGAASPERGSAAGLRRGLRRFGIDLRPGEERLALVLFLLLFLLITFQIATKTVRQSTFLEALGARSLPVVYLLVAVCSYPLLRFFDRVSGGVRLPRLLAGSALGVAALMVGFYGLMTLERSWVAVLFYVTVSILFGLLTAQFWSLSSSLLDARQAKRLFAPVGAGGLLGGIFGGQLARLTSTYFGTGATLLAAALVVGLVAVLMPLLPRGEVRAPRRRVADRAVAASGRETVRSSRYLRLIALLITLSIVVAQVVDLQFNWVVEQNTEGLDQRTGFFGNFYSLVGICAVLFQLVLTSRIHRRLGVGFALRVLPTTLGVATVALLTAGGFAPALLVPAAVMLKVGENGLRYSIDQATRELLFLPVPAESRVRAKAFLDVFVQRGAKGLAALALLPVTLGLASVMHGSILSLTLLVAWWVVAGLVYAEYVAAFRQGLEQRQVDPEIPIDLADVGTLEILMKSLGSTDPRQVLHSLDVLDAHNRGALVPPLLLYHDDPAVRRRTLEILAREERHDATDLIERRLGDDDPGVRAEAIRVLAQLHGEEGVELMVPRLREGDPSVKAAAIAYLVRHGDAEMQADARRVLADLMSQAEPEARMQAARALGAVGEPVGQEQLLQLLYDSDPGVVREAIATVRRRVVRDGYTPVYVAILAALLGNRRVRHDAREALVGFGDAAVPALAHFMREPDESPLVRRSLPRTLARIGSPPALEVLAEALVEDDPLLRRELIAALVALEERAGGAPVATAAVWSNVAARTRDYLEELAMLAGVVPEVGALLRGPAVRWPAGQRPHLLGRLLSEQMEREVSNLFGLIALVEEPRHVRPVVAALQDPARTVRANAVEFLDNTLPVTAREQVLAVVADRPLAQKLAAARQLAGMRPMTRRQTLEALLSGRRRVGSWPGEMVAAAAHLIHAERVEGMSAALAELEQSEDPFVRETALWVASRTAASAPPAAGGEL